MRNILLIGIFLLAGLNSVFAQTSQYMTQSGHIWFFSKAPLENIEAHNRQVQVITDIATGDLAFKVVMKNYEFQKAAMYTHFQEPMWLDTKKYPNSTFEGKISNLASVNFSKNGIYNVSVTGKLTIKGITKNVIQTGTLEVATGSLKLKSKFNILLADYGVKIPADNVTKISKTIEINIDATLTPYVR